MRLSEEEIALLLGKPGYRVIDTQAPRSPVEPSTPQQVSEAGMDTDGMPEGVLLGKIRRLALDNGWLTYHTHDSRKSDLGYPDLCCAKPGHPLLLLELKSQRGKLTKEQTVWLEFLAQTRGVHVGCYRPSQWSILEHLITRSTP